MQGEESTNGYHATKSREVGVDPLKKGMALVKFPIFEIPEGIFFGGGGYRRKGPISTMWSDYSIGRNIVFLA